MKNEDEIQQLIMMEAPKHGCILLRNNSGAMKDVTGRVVRYGLGHTSKNQEFKSSDLVGITKPGIFTAVEVKKEGWTYSGTESEIYQKNFIDFVLSLGGYAGFANSVDDFLKIIRK